MTDLANRVSDLSDTKRLALLRLLAEKNAESRLLELAGSHLKVLREGTPRLFFFPATEGSVAYMSGYVPHIPSPWGVYACQSPGLDGDQAPTTTVEEIAARGIEEIRRIQPEGPYYLAGNCMGGLPAFEAARQLEAAGAEVPLVLHLMPTFARAWKELPESESLQTRALHDYGFIIERLLGHPVDLPLERIAAAPEEERTDILVDFLAAQPGLGGTDPEVLRHRIAVYQANLGAMFAYRPAGGLKGRLHVLAVGEGTRRENVVDPGSPYAKALGAMDPARVQIDKIDAEASTLFDCAEPHMSRVGTALRAAVDGAAR
ncbi:thioesterase domain-containing protein [Streptomyces sp. BBFR2]|uniref:thioesterase domain-containing protein n=1 Tax=Streptomyces sp. BBFR2 TaxID=3372854 RepID=UPI0037DA1C7A